MASGALEGHCGTATDTALARSAWRFGSHAGGLSKAAAAHVVGLRQEQATSGVGDTAILPQPHRTLFPLSLGKRTHQQASAPHSPGA